MVVPIGVFPWRPFQMVMIGGLVLGVELVRIGNVPVGIDSLRCLLVERIVIGDISLSVHPLLWRLVVLNFLLGMGVASGFLFYVCVVGFRQ